MPRCFLPFGTLLFALVFVLSFPSSATKHSDYTVSSLAKYVQIPGAKPAGSEVCTTCHEDTAKDFRHALHAQQGVECEQCHGPGSLHVESGGDVSKIISFRQRSAADANGACLSCHITDASVRNWMTGRHASNKVRCTDCHQIHGYAKSGSKPRVSFDLMTTSAGNAVENLVPETKQNVQPLWQANDACLSCHQTQRGQMSLPYHHPLREGKMKCVDCHDAHGGPTGNNLRTANINQLCLACHAQYRGPFAYQHPPVTENCITCHTPHGSPNTNLLSLSEPALCLQCHASHHNGAGLPLTDRCTNCHGSVHGSDVPTPSGGSRFVDKGPTERSLISSAHGARASSNSAMPLSVAGRAVPTHPSLPAVTASGAMAMLSRLLSPASGGNMLAADQTAGEGQPETVYGAYSLTPGEYRFVDLTGFGGRVGEYDTLEQSAGANAATAYVSTLNHLTVVSRADVLSGRDYQAASQGTAGRWARFSFDLRSFVQQQDNYPFYAFPVLDVPPGTTTPPDSTSDLIPPNSLFGVQRRLGKAKAEFTIPKLPVHVFIDGSWQARSGVNQLSYLDENNTAAVFAPNPTPPPTLINTTCGEQCHHQSQFQSVNYTTRNIGGGVDIDLGDVRVTWEHKYSSFNDRLVFPTVTFTGPFTPENEGSSVVNPPPFGPAPMDVPAGNFPIDIPPPSRASTDRLSLNWVASPTFMFNGNVNYARLLNTFTSYPQNVFNTDETANWLATNRLRVTADYHQQNLINDFTPFYSMYGNISYHDHRAGVQLEYELPRGFDVEATYERRGITRSNTSLWPQVYSIDNTDLLMVVPSSVSNAAGFALRYHDAGLWSARAGYEWIGTHQPGYLIVPQSNNRIFADFTVTPAAWLTFTNDASIIVQNAFPAIALPNTPGDFQRRNRLYTETASAAFRLVPAWNLGFGYSYQQDNLTTYMAFQNDNAVGFVFDQPAVPYKQLSQSYWGETSYTAAKHLGLNLRLTYNSARSGFRPDLNPNDAALLGNQSLISSASFDPVMFAAAQSNLGFSATQISEVVIPQWIGQSKAYYLFPRQIQGGLVFYYGSYRDNFNPNLNGVLRTFTVYVGRAW
jgi:predicted CXXCH cytochrome family protein